MKMIIEIEASPLEMISLMELLEIDVNFDPKNECSRKQESNINSRTNDIKQDFFCASKFEKKHWKKKENK